MKSITASVTGYETKSVTTYSTQVTVDGQTWSLPIRYSAFHDLYTKLTGCAGSDFTFDFPKKGGLFSSPSPKEREPQLDAFVRYVVDYYTRHGFPNQMTELLESAFEIPQHMPSDIETKAEKANRAQATASPVKEERPEEPCEETCAKQEEGVGSCASNNAEEPQAPSVSTESSSSVVVEKVDASPVEETPLQASEDVKAATSPVKEDPVVETSEAPTTDAMPEKTHEAVAVEKKEEAADGDQNAVQKDEAEKADRVPEKALSDAGTNDDMMTDDGEPAMASSMKKPRKKKLSEAQKKLRNLRRREKRKKKANMKVNGEKTWSVSDGMLTESEDETTV